jgi:hypothetical protein
LKRRQPSESSKPTPRFGGGLFNVDEPRFDIPEIPDDLTAIDDKELMQLFSREVAWCNFFAARLSEAQVVEKYAEADLKIAELHGFIAAESKGKQSVTAQRAQRDMEPEVEAARLKALEAWAQRKAFEMAFESRERCSQLYSRELTRRTGGLATERRDRRWNP